jgi:thiol-disulfide isomerase/thioredoxin
MTVSRRWSLCLVAGGLLVLGSQVAQADTGGNAVTATQPDSAPLFAAALIDLSGKPASLTSYQGKPVVVNFWARWCGPCKVEIPELVSLQKRKTGVEVLGLNVESNAATVRDFAYAYDINYPVFLTQEPGLALMQALGNRKMVLPFTVVLNRQGNIVSTHVGAMTRDKLDVAVQLALKPVRDSTTAP